MAPALCFSKAPLLQENKEKADQSNLASQSGNKRTQNEIWPTPTQQQIFQLPCAKCTVHCPVTWICQFSTSKAAISTSLLCGCHSSRPQTLPGSLFP